MEQTLVEKIISKNMGYDVKAGETVVVNVAFAALHDGSGPLQDELFYVSAVPFDIQRGRYVSAELP